MLKWVNSARFCKFHTFLITNKIISHLLSHLTANFGEGVGSVFLKSP